MFSIAATLLFANLSLLAPPVAGGHPPIVEQSDPYISAPICHSMAADKTAVLGAGDESERVVSTGTSYAGRARCDRFVTDFRVLSTASAPHSTGRFEIGGGLPDAFFSDCQDVRVDVTIFKKARGSRSFTAFSHYVVDGEVVNPSGEIAYCVWNLVDGATGRDAAPNERGADTYRVAVKASRAGQAKQVEAWIRFKPRPPT